MQTKSLLYGLAGFFIGGLIVSIAASSLNQPQEQMMGDEMNMSQMTRTLANKTGEEYDKAFMDYMIDHHESAVDMARLSAANAKHDEIKKMSQEIISAQESEINQMEQWKIDWGYSSTLNHGQMMH